jgi:hypothetical protein
LKTGASGYFRSHFNVRRRSALFAPAFLHRTSRNQESLLKIAIFALSIQKRRYLRAKLLGTLPPNQISPDLSEVLHTATYEEAKNG